LAPSTKSTKLRRDKLKEIEALGQESYPRKYDFTHTIPQVLAGTRRKTADELEQSRVNLRVAGRIRAIRLMARRALPIFNRQVSGCRFT
jgi:lysyl-tRNA synthetase class 2